MNAVALHRTVISLWKRAPVWRFSAMSAALLSLLFALFPPTLHQESDIPTPNIPAQAEYTPQPAPPTPAPPLNVPSNVAAGQNETDNGTGVDAALLGRLYSGSIDVGGFKLPLPAGNWAMLASNGIASPKASGMSYFLGRIERKRLIGTAVIYAIKVKAASDVLTNELVLGHGCDFPIATYVFKEKPAENGDLACWYTHSFFTPNWQRWNNKTVKMNGLERAGAGNMAAMSITYPQDMVAVVFLRREKWGVLYATYHFSPESEGVSSNTVSAFPDSDWAPGNMNRFPEKLAYVEKLKNWAAPFWSRFKTAFAEGKPFP